MKISKRQLKKVIQENLKDESLLIERDLDYLNPLKYLKSGNKKVKEFKETVFKMLEPYYKNNKISKFFGTINRDIAKVIKKLYNDPQYNFVDRNFLQNEVRKFHYMRESLLENFLKNAKANRKDEISAVGYLDTDNVHSSVGGRGDIVAVELKGYVTLAANTNMLSGHRPTPAEKETFKSSGVSKNFYADKRGIVSNPSTLKQHRKMLFQLTNHINFVLDNIILDRESFVSSEQRVLGTGSEVGSMLDKTKDTVQRGFSRTIWNEFVLDNWEPIAIIKGGSFKNLLLYKEEDPRYQKAKNIIDIAKKYNLEILNPIEYSLEDVWRHSTDEDRSLDDLNLTKDKGDKDSTWME